MTFPARRRIRKAVIPVAGVGTRLLPATKSQAKEMLPVGRKPAVQYIVEEMAACQVDRILLVTGANKTSIEDHFDYDEELVRRLRVTGKEELLAQVLFDSLRVQIHYTRQPMQLGLGDAVAHGEVFTGEEPFVVALGDSIVTAGRARQHPLSRLVAAFESSPGCDGVIVFENIDRAQSGNYGIAQVAGRFRPEEPFRLEDIVEKPRPSEAPSTYAVAGRYVFTPSLYAYLKRIRPGYGEELQLTDAIRLLIRDGGQVLGILMTNGERRFDIGNYESYWKAFLHFALRDPELGPALREFARVQLEEL
jgi:UTP--glucose-1-phosphate uridylyltransferase